MSGSPCLLASRNEISVAIAVLFIALGIAWLLKKLVDSDTGGDA